MKRATLLIVFFALILGSVGDAFAQTRSLEEGPVVRRQLLYRSSRVEVSPALAHSLNDPYRRTLFLNVGLNYHLTNVFSLGINLAWGALSYNTNILDEIEATDPARARQLSPAEPTLYTDFHVGWVPLYGKFNFLRLGTVNYDLHLMGGLAGALLSSDNPDIAGFNIGGVWGIGWRFFFSGSMAISFDFVDYMYTAAEVSRDGEPVSESFSNHFLISIGVSFFVTGDLRVSR